ncbi:fibronectin type III domain-containing protein, partial [Psychroserpens mesophilus]|uniref:fibronectin type III domain-containing protein n=1 Tax=Psychroserpens mesophilus TaxID=325473 RepID=UPI003D649BB9
MKKFTLIALVLFAFCWQSNAQSIVIGTGTTTTDGSGSDPIDDFYNSFRYQVVYTAAELSASLTPYDEITALGWSVSENGGQLLGYTIKMGHTSATNSAAHDASVTSVVKNAFDYTPTVTTAGVFDMITFDTNFVWNGVDNIVVEVCTDGQNPFGTPYGGVRGTTLTTGSRFYRVDGGTACGVNTNSTNGNRPNIQFNYIDGTPPACLPPTALTIDSFTATTAEISWTAANSETDWEIAVQIAGTGVPGAADNTGTDTTSNPYSATGLTGSTTYEVYVRADCDGDGLNLSSWSGPLNFTTSCVVETAPYTEDFENGGALPLCWTLAGDENWLFSNTGSGNYVGDNGTLSGSTASGGYFAWLDDSTPDATNAELRSPLVDVSGLTTPSLSFYEISDNEGANPNATLTVDVWDGAAWNTVGTYNTNTNGWEQKFIDLSGLTFTGPAQARFLIADSGSFYDDIAIDDVSFDEYPACFAPSALTIDSFNASSATISWTAGPSSETDWEVVVQADGTGEPAGAGTATSTNPYFALGLTPSTAYEVYLRANCGGGDFSGWIGPVDFTTSPIAPPSCITTYTSTPDAACGNNDTTLSWDPVIADGYFITVGSSTGANDILDNVDLGDVTSTTVSSQNPNTTYYYTISPYNVVGTNTTCTEQTYTTFATGCLCDSIPSSNDNNGISNVRLGITDYPTADVTYFDHSGGGVVDFPTGVPTNVEITFETGYSYGVNIWIDLNDNSTLEPSELMFTGESTNANPVTFQADFAVPGGSTPGIHKMRIVTDDTVADAADPCNSSTFGVTLDFDVNVTVPACTPAVIASTTVVDDCGTGTFNVDIEVTDPGTATFIVGIAPTPIVAGTNTVGPFNIGDTSPSLEIIDITNPACNISLGTFTSNYTPPSGLSASNVTGTTADLAWTVNGPETAWEVLILPDGDPTPAGTTSGTDVSGANPYTVTGLTAQTPYDAYVRGMCGANPEWIGPLSFTTACDTFTPAYTEDFTTFLDTCWEEATDGDLTAGPASFGSGGFGAEEFAHVGTGNGAVNINMYLGGPDIDWLLSPTFDLSADGYQLEVDVAMTDYNATTQNDGFNPGDEVRIVYSNDGTNWTTLVTYDDTNVPASAGQTEIVDLTGITGTNVQFAFYVSEGTTGRDIDFHIDNFKVRTPPTCFDVSDITLDNVSTTSADISWTNAGAETNWEIAVQTAGTGTPGTANDTGANTASNPYSASGLTAQTNYEVYVRAECTLGLEFGEWIGPLNFSTTCNPINTFPWTEDFESITTPDLPICWSALNENADGDAFQTWETYGAGGSNAAGLYTDFNGGSNDDYLILPQFTLTGNQELSFSVRARSTGEPNDYRVVLSTTGTAATDFSTELQALTTVSNTTHAAIDPIRLTDYTGDVYIAIHVPNGGLDGYYIYFDDFSIVDLPPCVDPTDVTITPFATTVDISWTPGTDETAWEFEIGLAGFTPTETPTASATNPLSIPGLPSETSFDIYLRSDCSGTGDGFSVWTGPFNFTTTASCPDVTAITLDSATGTTADISWTNGSLETDWEIVVQTAGTGEPAATDDSGTNTSSNPHSATGLSPETAYEVYVRAECTIGSEFSNWTGPFNFTTPCAAITPDYAADMSTNAPDSGSCWVEAGSGEVAAGPSDIGASDWTTGSYIYGDSNRINLYSNVDREWLVSPPFDLSAGGYQLVVNVAVTNWNSSTVADVMGSDDEVQLVMSTDNGATWTNLTTWTAADALQPSGTDYLEDLTGVTGSNVLFAIMASDGTVDDNQDYDFHIGRFEVRTPPACPEVIAITASNVTTTSADIGWTNGGSETAWEVAIQAVGTGEPAAANDSGTNSSTNPYNATGLTSNTAYEVYVRAECVDGVEFGLWAGPFNFSTPCDAVTDFSENFDSVTTPDLPDCWSSIIDNGASSFASVTSSTSADSSLPNGVSLYNSDSPSTSNIILVSPVLSNLGDGTHRLRFNARNSTATQDIEVGTLSDPTDGSTFTALTTVDLSNTFDEYEVSFAGYSGTDTYIGVRRLSTSTYTYVYLDDITWEALPSCLAVSDIIVDNITTTSADITWTAGGSETDWEIVVQAAGTGAPGLADGSGTDTTSNNPYNASGLTTATAYEVYVRAECVAGTDFGAWVGPVNFATTCDVVTTFPLFEDFEGNGDVIPTCWTQEIETGTTSWTFASDGDNGGSGTSNDAYSGTRNALFVDSDTADDITKLVSPALDLTGLSSPELSFWHTQEIWSPDQDELSVYYKTSAGGTWTLLATYTNSIQDWTQETIVLPSPSADYYIAFEGNAKYGRGVALDDVSIFDNIPGTYTYTDGVWSPSTPANDLDDIIVASGNLVLSSDLTCNSMIVNPGASVTVNSGTTLEATNGLLLESSSTSYSSLIRNGTIVGTLEYERHVNINGSGTTGSNDLVSAPLTGQPFNVFAAANPNILTNNDDTLYLFGPFNKGTGAYVTWANTETATLDPGVGYRAGSTDNGTFTFTGTANNGNVTHDIVNAGPNNAAWNLVGNPYPSYMNVQQFLLHDVGGVINLQLFDAPTAAIYGYDGSALNGWTVYNLATTTASTVIAPGQGFFVSADATNDDLYDLEFTPAMR